MKPRELNGKDFFECEEFPLSVFRMPFHDGANSLHRHDFDEIMIVIGGSANHHVGRKISVLRRGDVYIIPCGAVHAYETEPEEKLEVINILFDSSRLPLSSLDLKYVPGFRSFFLRNTKRPKIPPPLNLSADGMALVLLCVSQMEAELSDQSPGYLSMTFSYFVRLLCLLARSGCSQPLSLSPPEVRKLRVLVAHLEQNLEREISVKEMAQHINISPSYLRSLFHRVYAQSPVNYVRKLRIARAMELLAVPEISITEVAYKTGFNDSNYFTRVFHKHTGECPTDFRKRVLNT